MRNLKTLICALAVALVLPPSTGVGAAAVAAPARAHDVDVRKVYLDCERGADVRLVVSYGHGTDRVRFRVRGHGAREGTRWRWTLRVTTGRATAGASGMEVKAQSFWSSGVLSAPDDRRHVARARVEGPRGETCRGVYR
jgi:hypothetical protein